MANFPDMLCMKKVHRKKCATVHWSAARNEERPSSRGKNADKPRALSPHRFTWDFVCACFRRVIQDGCLRCPLSPGEQEGRLSPGRTDSSASHPARPRSAPAALPYAAAPRPARGMSGFLVRLVTTSVWSWGCC